MGLAVCVPEQQAVAAVALRHPDDLGPRVVVGFAQHDLGGADLHVAQDAVELLLRGERADLDARRAAVEEAKQALAKTLTRLTKQELGIDPAPWRRWTA